MGCASPRDSFCGGLPRSQGVPSPSRFRDGHHNFVVTRRRSSYLQDSFTFKIPRRAPQLRCDAPSLIIPTGFLHHCAGLHRRWSLLLETTSGGAAPLSVGLYACAVKKLPRPQGVPSPSRFRDGHHNFVVTRRRSSFLQDYCRNRIPRHPTECLHPSPVVTLSPLPRGREDKGAWT